MSKIICYLDLSLGCNIVRCDPAVAQGVLPGNIVGHSPDIRSQKTSKAQNIPSQLPSLSFEWLNNCIHSWQNFSTFSLDIVAIVSLNFTLMHNRENKTTSALLLAFQ